MKELDRSFLETFYEVVAGIYSHPNSKVIDHVEQTQGRCGMYDLAIELTCEFEEINRGRQWDGEFFDEIDEFLNQKL